jgi:phage-related protein
MAAHEPVCGRANIMDVIDKGEIYLTFIFDGIDSSQVGVASISDGSTYDTPILPSFTDNTLEVDGYNGRYYFNTRITQKDFTYNCFIDNLSAYEFGQLKTWLRPEKIGKLIRPEEPYVYYWVKVSSIDNLANIPLTHPDTGGVSYTGNFSVTFTTIGQTCGNGMFYYYDDLKYYEYRDIIKDSMEFYDTGLLYREQMLPMNVTRTSGTWEPQIYNPGTYNSKIRLVITPSADINGGAITLTNETIGDVGVINLNDLKANDELIVDWGNNSYIVKRNVVDESGQITDTLEIDYSKNVHGDIMYLQPRNFVEKLSNAMITNDGSVTKVTFDKTVRQVRTDDIGKTIMFPSISDAYPNGDSDGAGGRIKSIDNSDDHNDFILEASAGLWTNGPSNVIITLLDELKSEVNIPDGTKLDIKWQIEPRYI